jgi:hypothetical protein
LHVIELRLQERRLRVELLRGGLLRLRAERPPCAAVRRPRAGTRPQREQLLRDRDHLAGAFHLVVGRLHAKLDVIRNPREVLLGLRELRLALAQDGALAAAVEQVDARANRSCRSVGKERQLFWKL